MNFAFNFAKLKDFGLIFLVSCWKPFVLVYLTMYSCYATTINNAWSMLTCHTHSSIDLLQVDEPFLAAKRPTASDEVTRDRNMKPDEGRFWKSNSSSSFYVILAQLPLIAPTLSSLSLPPARSSTWKNELASAICWYLILWA